jgi:hypothetical protein
LLRFLGQKQPKLLSALSQKAGFTYLVTSQRMLTRSCLSILSLSSFLGDLSQAPKAERDCSEGTPSSPQAHHILSIDPAAPETSKYDTVTSLYLHKCLTNSGRMGEMTPVRIYSLLSYRAAPGKLRPPVSQALFEK